jgi:hypothetical protein
MAFTFHAVCLGWLFFRAESLAHAGRLLAALLEAPAPGLLARWLLPLAVLTLPLLAMQLWQAAKGQLEPVVHAPGWVRCGIYVATAFFLVLLGEDFGAPFIYFQF